MKTSNTTDNPSLPEDGEVGPNGYPVGYLDNGDKVEWLPDDLHPGENYPLLLRRNDNAIDEVRKECWEKVWWGRNVARLHQEASNRGVSIDLQMNTILQGNPSLMRIVEKYGLENLGWSEFEWGLLCGRLSALRWVGGAEWADSLDT